MTRSSTQKHKSVVRCPQSTYATLTVTLFAIQLGCVLDLRIHAHSRVVVVNNQHVEG